MGFALLGLLLIHMRLSETRYMPEVGDSYTLLYQALTAVYCILYLSMFAWVLMRFCLVGRLCSLSNFLFMLVSLGFIVFGVHLCQLIGEEAYDMQQVMS